MLVAVGIERPVADDVEAADEPVAAVQAASGAARAVVLHSVVTCRHKGELVAMGYYR